MDPLRPLALYQPTTKQLEIFAVDDNGSVQVVWKEHHNLSWRRAPISLTGVMPAGAPLGGAFFAPQEMLAVFVVGLPQGRRDATHGFINVLSKLGNGQWDGPRPIRPSGNLWFAPETFIAAAHYPPHGTLEVLAVANDGAVWVLWMSATDAWRFHPLTHAAFAKAGQPVALAYYPDHNTLEALVVGADRGVHVLAKSATTGWSEVGITPRDIADEGTHVSLVYHEGHGQLEGFIVDRDGRVLVLWKTPTTHWQWVPLTDAGFAPPGAPISAVRNATHDQLEVFVVGNDRALWVLWKTANNPFNQPFRLSETMTFAARAPVATTYFPPADQLEVLVGDERFLAREMTKYENRRWRPCAVSIGPRSAVAVVSQAQTSRLMQLSGSQKFVECGVKGIDLGANTTHKGTHFIFFGDVPRYRRDWGPGNDADAVAYVKSMDESAMDVEILPAGNGLFAPFKVRFPDGIRGSAEGQPVVMELGKDETPTGAFSHGDYVYVFVLVRDTPVPVTHLARSRDPFNGEPYEVVFSFRSRDRKTGAMNADGRFWQVAPWVVPELPELPRGRGEGVVMLGQGVLNDDADGVYLAWMPLGGDGPQASQIWYHTNAGLRQRRLAWTRDESRAKPLWTTTRGYSSISLAHIPGAARWIALYSHAALDTTQGFYRERGAVVARIGTSLTGWSSREIVVFDPCRDGAYGNFMHWPDLDELHLAGYPDDDVAGWAYGAFLIPPLIRWHAEEREVTIHYLLSTSRPYQVQLMRSRFKIDGQ